jgi:nucleotide-binding universal stress UspA family protein
VHLVYVIEPPTIPQWGYAFLALREDKLRAAAARQMETLRRAAPQGVPLTFEILSGAGAEYEICELAKKRRSDLIVMASHGWGKVKRVLLGSTAERIVRHAPCPVLIVKQ